MDERFELLRQRYRERAANQLRALEAALASADREATATVAHKLSGSGAIFGFPQVSRLAEPLELAAEKGGDEAELRRLARPLLAELARIAQAA